MNSDRRAGTGGLFGGKRGAVGKGEELVGSVENDVDKGPVEER